MFWSTCVFSLQLFFSSFSPFAVTCQASVHCVQILNHDGKSKELHKGLKSLCRLLFAVHSPLVEPLYPCYLKAASMEWAWPADITLLCHRAGEGGGGRADRMAERSCGRTAGRGSFSATHCFVIVPVAFCPQLSSRKATRRDRS